MKRFYRLSDNPWFSHRRDQRRRFDRGMATFAIALLLTNVAFAAKPLTETTSNGNGNGAVCPPGDVKYEVGDGYEYTDGSATISVFTEPGDDKNQATWNATEGSVIDTVCIKIGGPGGGALIWPNVNAGQGGPYAYDISHVVIATDEDEQEPGLTFAKEVDSTTANPGDTITYTLTYKNTGEADLTNVVITETYDPRFNFVSANPAPTSDNNIWNIGLLPAGADGEISITGTLDQDLPMGTTVIHNEAVIDSTELDPMEKEADTIVVVEEEPGENTGHLIVNKHFDDNDDGQIDRTNPVGWTWDLVNGSQDNLGGANLELEEGDYTIQEDAIEGYASRWECSDNSDGVGVSANVEVEEAETLTCTFINTKTSIPPPDDPIYDIDLEKTGPATVNADNTLTYTLAWGVGGDTDVTQAVISDPLPTELSFVSATQGGIYDANDHAVTWDLGTKQPGDQGSVSVTTSINLPVKNGSELVNQACFDSAETDATCDGTTTTVTSGPQLSIVKTNSVTSFTNPGETVTYTVMVANASNATDSAYDVILTDVLPDGFTFAAGGGSTKDFQLGDLAPGESSQTVYLVEIDENQAAGIYTNVATATGSNTLPLSDTSHVEVRHPNVLSGTAEPALTLTKTVNPTVAVPGQDVTYTLVMKNVGDADARNVVITDTLPDGLTFVNGGGRTMVWTLAQDLEIGKSETITYQVHVWSKAKAGTYTNLAVARADDTKQVNADANLTVRAPRVLGLATTGAGLRDYLTFGLGLMSMVAGFVILKRSKRQTEQAA